MLRGLVRLTACVASGAAFLALTGCGGGQPEDSYSSAPPAAYDRGGDQPVLMGSTPPPARPADAGGLLGGPHGYAGMAPIPNPADLSRAERVKYYGHKYDYLPEPKGRPGARATASHPRHQLLTRRREDGTLEVSMRPIANPEDMTAAERRRVYGNRYAPRPFVPHSPRRRGDAAPSVTVAAAPKPVVKPAAAPKVAAPAVKPAAPIVAARPAAPAKLAPAPAPKLTTAEQLSAAVKPDAMNGAVLTVPEGLAKGEESKVSLALPASLFDTIKREAAKLGLGKAAKKQEVSATLTGEGYEITPNGPQTQALKPGQAATFDWNVKPGAGDKAPLKAAVDGALTGDKKARTTFSLATLEQAVAPAVEAVKEKAGGFKLPAFSLKSLAIPGMEPVNVPGVGKVGSEKLVGAGLALLALLLVLLMARNASADRARAERRRKFRTMQEGPAEAAHEPVHETVSQPYVNPMIAAAGGAAAGAAAVHVAHAAHDDHGHHDAHAHEAPAHDAHGHDAHADHGHAEAAHAAHDDHGHAEAHPVAHHAEPAHQDHGHGHDDHAPAAHAEDHGHHEAPVEHAAHHDDHAAHPVAHHPEPAHDDHGHGHEAPAAAHDDHGHAEAAHGHDDHGHSASHGHDEHHRQPEHA